MVILVDVLTGSPGTGQALSGNWTAKLQRLAEETGGMELEATNGARRIPDFRNRGYRQC